MKKLKTLLALCFFCGLVSVHAQLPSLSKKEVKDGWILLFDGKTFNGWKKSNGQPFTGKGWKIENGVLSVDPTDGRGGDIVTTSEFGDFELSLDFNLEKGTNSGVKYSLFKNTSLGCEYQIIDDANHPDAKLGKDGNRSLAALYDVLPVTGKKVVKPLRQWNNIRIVSKGRHVEHWLNGKKVLEYERGSEQLKNAVAESKFKNDKGWGEQTPSPILLQEHGDVIHFRNIKIKPL
ncbi:MAG TPA: DUF1080 domain-containing protein [Flavisolibacter sp.]|nr:DUF1080 domain-containing protein [Flavisolibacter sp.]